MPGTNTKALAKAGSVAADMLVLDLEDAVAPEQKADARAAVADRLAVGDLGHREALVRCNGLDSAWGRDDLAAAVSAGADGVLLPKVTSAGDVFAIDSVLDELGARAALGLWAMIEMPLALLNIREIAAAARDTRLVGLVMGLNDLAKELRITPTADRHAFQSALSMTVLAARAFDLVALDAVFNDIGDEAGLRAECEQGRLLGFDGKTLIHPAQLPVANKVFRPGEDELEYARAVIAAFDLPENRGKGVIRVDGRMTELLHLEQARRLVAQAAAIAAAGPRDP
jgi:citrate lyase subunit beta/citryl-CoA lyase